MNLNRVYLQKEEDVNPIWEIIDAKGQIVGRLATLIAIKLRGKDLATFTPHTRTPNKYVVVINADKVVFSGKKAKQKTYRKYTGYVGNDQEFTVAEAMKKDPTFILKQAVKRMMPKSKLGDQLFKKCFKAYVGTSHPHQGQINNVAVAA